LTLSNIVRPGVVAWAKTLARELGRDGITVNSIAPGRIETERLKELYKSRSRDDDLAQIPLARFGEPAEVASLVCFLASAQASYITGALIPVDGGLSRGLL
jgi:3-oxoacyl-[acyl-carrier protein] reductase